MSSVVFSLDAELAWGFFDQERPPVDRIEASRESWQWLLSLFDEYRVPATWAVVGHLFLEDCDGEHPSLGVPAGWFEPERGRFRDRPELRYGPDLVDAVLDATAEHEVGSHSFSHVQYDDPRLTRSAADADLEAAREVAAARDVDVDSFVFPRNAIGHRDALADHGFRAYRGAPTPRPRPFESVAYKLATFLDPGRLPLVEPYVDEYGLVCVPPSLYLFGFEGRPRDVVSTLWTDPVVRQARGAIDRAADEDGICHLWLHPNNVVTQRDRERIRAIVAHAARRRDEGALAIETMSDVADRVLDADPVTRPKPSTST